MSYQRRVIWNPVSHNDAALGSSHSDHLSGHVERPRCKHCTKEAHDQVKGIVFEFVQIASVAKLELAIVQARVTCAFPARLYKIAGDIDAEHVGAKRCLRNYGPGYRVYVLQRGLTIVVTLCGGDKRTQTADIKQAIKIAADWKE